MELFQAHNQWSSRPDDQRFANLQDLYTATKGYFKNSIEKAASLGDLRAEKINDEVHILGQSKVPARLTHYAFGQLSTRIGAPASYLRQLPATLAVQNLNHGLASWVKQAGDNKNLNLLFHQNGSLLLRALTTDVYERVWNWEIAERLLELETRGWTPATPDVRVIDDKLPIYASDHDLFVFLMHNERVLREGSKNPLGLKRGVIVRNSEVGDSKLWLLRFLYREMCGNHIIWGAEDVLSLGIVHRGKIRDRMREWDVEIQRYLDSTATDDEAKIQHAVRTKIAGTKEEVLNKLFGLRIPALTRKTLTAGYDAVVPDEDGDPRTVWGVVQGLTRFSQTLPYGDERTMIDQNAGKLLDRF